MMVPAQTQQLPIEDLIALQALVYQGWSDPTTNDVIYIDAYGRINSTFALGLGTTVTGKYSVRNLSNGTQSVNVIVHTRNALCHGRNGANQLAFGYLLGEVLGGVGPAALGTSSMRIQYAPQPIGPFDPYGAQESVIATVHCEGLLRAGSGFAEGTPGTAKTTQTGLYSTGVPAGCPPEQEGNCFPAEHVTFRPVGQP